MRRVHGRLREVAASIRKDKAGPRELARGLENVAGAIRIAEQRLSSARQTLARMVREGRAPDAGARVHDRAASTRSSTTSWRAASCTWSSCSTRRRAQELVEMARDLAEARRELADTLDRFRRAPTEEARQELTARIARMKERMNELLRRMAEQAKGLSDEHMNRDALAELAKSGTSRAG